MNVFNLTWLTIMTVVFLIWCGFMLRTLWRLTLVSMERLDPTGEGFFHWVLHSLIAFDELLTSKQYRHERRKLLLLTTLLFAIIVARPLLLVAMM